MLSLVEERLAGPERDRAVAHAEGCERCRELLVGLIRATPRPAASPPETEELALAEVDPATYTLGEELARGGMGRIVAARDNRHGRPVAIKMLLGHASARRFAREAWITARLQHPAIVPIYEAGRWPSGEPFIAMKRVEGTPLSTVVAEKRALPQRLALVARLITAVDATAYAHAHGVVHRDLKPANILLGRYGEVVVIDWGLAKVVGEPEPDAPLDDDPSPALDAAMTAAGTVIGTPLYMSPEQASGAPVGPASDVYSFGAVLYHLLAGRPPYTVGSAGASLPVLAGPPEPLRAIAPRVPQELVAIVHKAMAGDPAERYPTGAELAEELRRFTTGAIVRAHSYSAWELLRRVARRHRAFVAAAAVALALGTAYTVRVVGERDTARRRVAEGHVEQGRQGLLAGDRFFALLHLGAAVEQGQTGTGPRFMLARAEQALDKQLAVVSAHGGDVYGLAIDGASGRFASGGGDGTVKLWDPRGALLATLKGHEGAIRSATFTGGGARLVTTSDDHSARVWEVPGGELLFVLAGHEDSVTGALDAGARLLTRSRDRTIRVWDSITGAHLRTLTGHAGPVNSLALASDGRRLASASSDKLAKIWDLETGAVVTECAGHGHAVASVAFSPDGTRVVTGSYDGKARVFDAATGAPLLLLGGHRAAAFTVSYAPGGAWILTGSHDKTARLWDATTGAPVLTLGGHDGALTVARFSADGGRVLTASVDGTAALWATSSGKRLSRLIGHRSVVAGALFSGDGARVVTSSLDGEVRLWDARADDLLATFAHEGQVRFARFVEGGRVVTASADGLVRAWDPGSGRLLASWTRPATAPARNPSCLGDVSTIGRDGTRFVQVDGARLVIWDLARPEPLAIHRAPDGKELACVDLTDELVFVGSSGGVVRAIRARDGEVVTEYRGHGESIIALVVSRDGTRLATASAEDGATRIWDVATGRQLAAIDRGGHAEALELSPDNTRLVTASDNGVIRIWDTRTGALLDTLDGHTAEINHLRYSRDGRLLASAGLDMTARVWDTATGGMLSVFTLHEHTIHTLDFDDDGERLLTGSLDGTARIWDTSLDTRPPDAIVSVVRCQVPFRLQGNRVAHVRARPEGCP